MPHKIVNMPISVPTNDYCWDGHMPCEYFDNEGGYGRCVLGFYPVDRDNRGTYPKPDACKALKEIWR